MTPRPNPMPAAIDSSGSAVLDLAPEMRLCRQPGVVLCHVDGKHMLVPAMTNQVDLDCLFLLNDTGVFVWEQLDGRRRIEHVGDAMATVFGISCGRAVEDVSVFLSTLLDHRLVEVADRHW